MEKSTKKSGRQSWKNSGNESGKKSGKVSNVRLLEEFSFSYYFQTFARQFFFSRKNFNRLDIASVYLRNIVIKLTELTFPGRNLNHFVCIQYKMIIFSISDKLQCYRS